MARVAISARKSTSAGSSGFIRSSSVQKSSRVKPFNWCNAPIREISHASVLITAPLCKAIADTAPSAVGQSTKSVENLYRTTRRAVNSYSIWSWPDCSIPAPAGVVTVMENPGAEGSCTNNPLPRAKDTRRAIASASPSSPGGRFWSAGAGSIPRPRRLFSRSARNCCALPEAIAIRDTERLETKVLSDRAILVPPVDRCCIRLTSTETDLNRQFSHFR